MSETTERIIERSFRLRMNTLSCQLGEPLEASRFLFRSIGAMISKGERRKIALANRAIDAYRRSYNLAA